MKKLFLLVVAAASVSVPAADLLNVGHPAPALKVGKWIKGKPISKLDDGKVRVVEFWATWCGPCRVSIPHLTELAKKYSGKVDFIGVSVWEAKKNPKDKTDDSYMPAVEKFVADYGAKMDYNVAADGPEGTMAETWMQAANERGIPAAFVVDGTGRIMWIGHPMDEKMVAAIDGTLAGNWDWKSEADRRAKEMAEEMRVEAIVQNISTLEREGKAMEALTALDKALKEEPTLAPRLNSMRYRLLLRTDEAAVDQLLREAIAEGTDLGLMYNGGMDILNEKSPRKVRDYGFAVELFQAVNAKLNPPSPMVLRSLSKAQALKGDWEAAVATLDKAIGLVEADKEAPATLLEGMKKEREAYRQKKLTTGN
jgi:thiol-disulfide isomerase/thioredoxin